MVILSLGSNLGDRKNFLRSAITLLSEFILDIQYSAIYESPALLPEDFHYSWNIPFLNMNICGKTIFSPEELLLKIKIIEEKIGRKNGYKKWSPRKIDIDILAYGDILFNQENLIIPHKELLRRDFFLLPLNDILPNWEYPVKGNSYGKTASELLKNIEISAKRIDY